MLRQQGHEVDIVHPKRSSRVREGLNILLGVPRNRARFATRLNRRLVKSAYAGHDLTILSWEPLDALSRGLPKPLVLVAHNVTSLALPRLFPRNPLAKLLAWQAARWESKLYQAKTFSAIAVLSQRDREYVAGLKNAPPVLLTIPGMPPVVPLSPGAPLRDEIILSGTYDWRPKRRDVIRFSREYAQDRQRFPIFSSPLPREAHSRISTAPLPSPETLGQAIRFGLITDRFESGHKLKTLAYIAQNQIVLSFCDVAHDFSKVPEHDFFVRRLTSAKEISEHMAAVSQEDLGHLRERLKAFQNRCAACFSWDGVAKALTSVLVPP